MLVVSRGPSASGPSARLSPPLPLPQAGSSIPVAAAKPTPAAPRSRVRRLRRGTFWSCPWCIAAPFGLGALEFFPQLGQVLEVRPTLEDLFRRALDQPRLLQSQGVEPHAVDRVEVPPDVLVGDLLEDVAGVIEVVGV